MVVKENTNITQAHFEEAKKSAYTLLDSLDSSLIYHRKEHTTGFVVPSALAIAEIEGFSLEDRLLVGIAAAFHDTGFVRQYNANEPIGAQLAEEHMRASQHSYSENHIVQVKDAINNTNMKIPPQTMFASALRDADLSYIGAQPSERFLQWVVDLQKEAKLHPESPLHNTSSNNTLWGESSLNFIATTHKWFTNGAKSLYEPAKQQNILALKKHYQLR